jgi:sulfur-oxidizing protein SoxB
MSAENKTSTTENNRRDFLKKTGLASLAVAFSPLSNAIGANNDSSETEEFLETLAGEEKKKKQIVSLLITSDIHGQLFTHDEFFWENNQAVYKKRGGMATLKTMIDTLKKKNPANTIVYDGGDYFHGHAIAL